MSTKNQRESAKKAKERTPMASSSSCSTPTNPLSAEVSRRIDAYAPKDIPPEVWESTLAPFVVPALRAAAPIGTASMEQFARVLTLISAWCLEQGLPLDIEVVLDPDTVERFFLTGLKDLPSRGTYRTVLRRLGRELTKDAPWQPRPEGMTRRKVALPYTQAEMEDLWQDAQHQSTPVRKRAAVGLIALGAGAGLDGRWVRFVRGTDVEVTPSAVLVHVGEPSRRVIAVLERYEDTVCQLAEEAGEGFLIGGETTHRNRTNKLVARVESGHGHPRLSVPRLRSTWVVEHLTRGTRLPELIHAAGTRRIETFDELLAYVPPLGEQDAQRALRGRT